MFEFLKKMLPGKSAQEDANGQEHAQINHVASSAYSFAPQSAALKSESRPGRPGPRFNGQTSNKSSDSVEIPLQAVLSGLSLELKGRVKQSDVGDATMSISLQRVLSQLALGAVKISFGELRRAAPQLFSSASDRDQLQVALPLNEILLQVNPALLARRQDQRKITVPDDIRSPFGDNGNGLIFSVGPSRAETPAAPRVSTPAAPSHPRALTAAPKAPVQPTKTEPQLPAVSPIAFRGPPASTPTPPPPAAKSSDPPPATPAPPAFRGVGAAPDLREPPAAPPPATAPRRAMPQPARPAPQPARGAPQPLRPAVQSVRPAGEAAWLSIPLTALAEGWPEVLRLEINQTNLMDAKVALPVEQVAQALKQGKVAFSWKVLRAWIKPAPLPTVSVHDAAVLELPLKVIAPLFLARQRESGLPKQRVAIDENIPNLFFGFPQPGTPVASEPEAPLVSPHAVTKPVDTNYYVWDDTNDVVKSTETDFLPKDGPGPATTFVTRCATPNEVVSRAAALDGVAGALIALPDGLMVASRLAPDLNGDTLAAFLPHIFSKVSQCTKELRMGELNNLNFTVGNVPWKIFRVNAIFFAAFGHTGQPLPTAQLAALAAELDRKKQ